MCLAVFAVVETRRSAHEKEESVLVAPTTFMSSAPMNGLMSLARGGWWGWCEATAPAAREAWPEPSRLPRLPGGDPSRCCGGDAPREEEL